MANDPYVQNGFKDRQDYLDNLAEDYGPAVYILADILGPNEDFDGLVTSLEDGDGDMLDE
jgi:hypothetical protein